MNDSALSPNNQLDGAGAAGRRASRTRFSKWQVKTLQEFFDKNAHPNEDDSKTLSDKLNLSLRVIAVWFQNARQKARKIYDTLPGECEDRTPELSNRHVNGSTQAFSLGFVKLDTTMDTQPKDPQMQQHQSFIAPPLNLDSNVVEKSENSSAATTLDNSPASKISLKRSFMESPKIVQSEAAKLRSESFKKRQLFNEYTKACGRNSLRAKLTKTEFDYETLFDLDHRYSIEKNDASAGGDETLSNANRSYLDAATSTNNKPKRFYRELFFSQYSRLAFGEAEVLLNDLDVVEETAKKTSATSGKLHQTTCPTPSDRLDDGGEDVFKESEKCAEKLKRIVAYFEQVPSSNDDESSSQSSTSGNKVDDNDKSNDWQEKMKQTVSKQVGWKVLEKITKVLFDELLVILATVGRSDKTNVRENSRNKNASRLRLAFVDVIEDQTSLQSIHSTLVQHLPLEFLATYVELLKVLKAKTPDVASLVYESDPKSNQNLKSKAIRSALDEYFESRLVSNAVDIVDYSSVQIAKNPIFVLFSPALRAFGDNYQPPERCQQFYRNLLPQIGKCFEIKFLPFKKDLTMLEANEKLFDQAHEKLMEIMKAYPTRHIVLVGWDASCLVAAMLTLHYPVAACVCFSFPNVTLNGLRGDVDDDILNITCPVLFVVGQFSSTCSLDDLRDTNEHMSSKNVGLIVVGGANNELKVSHNKLCTENVTQRIVDKCILDNVAEFLNDVLIVLPDVFCTPEEQTQEIVS